MRVAVIGSGIGGLCAGLVLSKQGHEVHVFEKEKTLGGSFTSVKKRGYVLDTGLHLLTRGKTGSFPKLIREFVPKAHKIRFVKHDHYDVIVNDVKGKIPGNVKELFKISFLSKRAQLDLFRMFFFMFRLTRKNAIKYRDKSVYEVLGKYMKNQNALVFINGLCYMTTGSNVHECAFSRFIDGIVRNKSLKTELVKSFSSGHNIVETDFYPVGGLRNVPDMFIRAGNLKVHKSSEVKKINIEDFVVKGVKVNGEDFKADIVVNGGEVSKLPKMLPKKALTKEEEELFKSIKEYEAMTLWMGFRKKIGNWKGKSRLIASSELKPPIWVLFMTDIDKSLAPIGHQLLGASTIVTKESRKKQEKRLLEVVESQLPKDYEKYVDFKEVQVHRAEKALQSVGKGFWDLPEQKTSIKGLYLAGTDTQAWGSGATICANAAMKIQEYANIDFPS